MNTHQRTLNKKVHSILLRTGIQNGQIISLPLGLIFFIDIRNKNVDNRPNIKHLKGISVWSVSGQFFFILLAEKSDFFLGKNLDKKSQKISAKMSQNGENGGKNRNKMAKKHNKLKVPK